MRLEPNKTVVIGAGPAGLTAAYLLSRDEVPVVVLEADPTYVGGIARTEVYRGYHFDIGGHRFFSKSQEVEALWTELLPDDMLERPRSSRIYYDGKFFSYPLKAFEALFRLGVFESLLCVLSYVRARLAPIPEPRNFEEWVSNQFGARLYRTFFKTYTEKVWGMPCTQISADWAAQRIKGLSLWSAIWNALRPRRKQPRGAVIKTLIDAFRYPRRGPGQMWEAAAQKTRVNGGEIRMGCRFVQAEHDPSASLWRVEYETAAGVKEEIEAHHVISSAPLRELMQSLHPAPSSEALRAAEALRYRDFLTVMLIVNDAERFTDNWIYIHDPSVAVGRIQNFKSWSPDMVPDSEKSCYGLEYFCFEGDGLWESRDDALIAQARDELVKLGLADADDIVDGCVVRQKKAYPVYDDDYATHVETIRRDLAARYPNLHVVGRNGMHKYNNQDHAMMTAMLTARNIIDATDAWDVWAVNQDAEYHESGAAGGERLVPKRV